MSVNSKLADKVASTTNFLYSMNIGRLTVLTETTVAVDKMVRHPGVNDVSNLLNPESVATVIRNQQVKVRNFKFGSRWFFFN